MNLTPLLTLFLACASLAQAAPPKVAVIADSDALRSTISAAGAQVVDASALNTADVLVLQSATADSAAVEAFVKKGGGLVVVGSGITAGEWLKPLAGGAWTAQSRKFASKMMLFTLTDAHPITRGATPFDLDDETVYDLDLDPKLEVLASAFTSKVTGKREPRPTDKADRANVYDLQPQIWAYEGADKHRAVVLLQGQPASLQHTSIRNFILRGIAWAAKHDNVDELCAPAELAALRYPKGGAQTAAETVKTFELQPGFTASVIASEPLITKPIAMQWDARGRLWIAETPEYPNGRRPLTAEPWKETGVLEPGKYDRPAKDRISILSEPDAAGQFTKKTVFFEGLELITGFCLYGDGVIVVAQPDIVFIHGEGAQQKVERLYTGFAPGDTHFVANHFIAAPDGWIYANSGSGANAQSVAHPEVTAKTSSGVFRFKPDGTAIEQVSSKGGNAFGLDITSDGEIFWGQATSGQPLQHVVLPESILAKAKVGTAASAESVIKGRKVARTDLPTRAPFMQIDQIGGYSSACASTVYEGGAWPAEWNRSIFCTEPILDIIHREKLVPAGATFTGEMAPADQEWLRAQDFWFFPVDVEFGPDGAMYILDFYCPIVAHNDTRGPLHSKSGASVRPDRDHYFGRIYRIQADGAKPTPMPDLSKASLEELALAFQHPNRLVRFTAHRLLMERPDAARIAPLLMSMTYPDTPATARILSLWALQRLGLLSPEWLKMALETSDVGVKKSALLVAEAMGTKNTVDLSAMLNDPEPRVRLLALRAMASRPLTTKSATALLAILPKLDDDWSRSAAAAAASSNPGPVLVAALSLNVTPSNALLEFAGSLARGLSDRNAFGEFEAVVAAAGRATPAAAPLVRAVLEAGVGTTIAKAEPGPDYVKAVGTLVASTDPAIVGAALPYAAQASMGGLLKSQVAQRVDALLAVATDSAQPDGSRGAALRGLMRVRQADPRITNAAVKVLQADGGDALKLDVIAALASTGDPALGKPLVAALPTLSPLAQSAAYDALTTRADWSNTLLDALQKKELKPTILGPARLSKLRLHSDPATAKRALKVIDEIGGGTNPAKDDIIAKLEPLIESKAGNAANGKVLFNTTCGICHKLNGEGKEVGPVLDGMGVHGTHDLLVHIIDPSRVVDDEHRTWNIALKNGSFATGIIGRENEKSVTLRLPGGIEQEVKVADIKSRQNSGLSLMPEGLEALGADSLRDILAYMGGGSSKYRALNLGRAFTTSTVGGLYNTREAKNDTVQPVKYGVVTVEGVPFSLPDPSTTPTGGNVIVLQNTDGKSYASGMPQRVEIPVGFAAGNLHFLGGVAGWGGGPEMHKPAMKVTIEHADGKKEVDELYTGDVFTDYLGGHEVPGSQRARQVLKDDRAQVRYFSLPVQERAPIVKLTLESYRNGISPTTLAITSDNESPKPRAQFVAAPAEPKKPDPALPASGETLPTKVAAGVIRALLIGGGSSHDFEKFFNKADSATLQAAGKITTAYTSNADEALALLPNADVVVLSANHPSFGTPEFQKALGAFADAGHGVVIVHAGVWYNWPPLSGYNKRFVGGGARGHGKGEFAVYNKQPTHPVMEGVPAEFKIIDEHYRVILDPDASVEILAETEVEKATDKAYPSVWISKDPKARFLNIALGHAAEAHGNPAYQKMLVNAVRWVAGK